MEITRSRNDAREPENSLVPEEAQLGKPPAWDLIETGRYQPRRIKGSLIGRELG
jgi:hypothetical protein